MANRVAWNSWGEQRQMGVGMREKGVKASRFSGFLFEELRWSWGREMAVWPRLDFHGTHGAQGTEQAWQTKHPLINWLVASPLQEVRAHGLVILKREVDLGGQMKDMKQSSNSRVKGSLSFRSISCTSSLSSHIKEGWGTNVRNPIIAKSGCQIIWQGCSYLKRMDWTQIRGPRWQTWESVGKRETVRSRRYWGSLQAWDSGFCKWAQEACSVFCGSLHCGLDRSWSAPQSKRRHWAAKLLRKPKSPWVPLQKSVGLEYPRFRL